MSKRLCKVSLAAAATFAAFSTVCVHAEELQDPITGEKSLIQDSEYSIKGNSVAENAKISVNGFDLFLGNDTAGNDGVILNTTITGNNAGTVKLTSSKGPGLGLGTNKISNLASVEIKSDSSKAITLYGNNTIEDVDTVVISSTADDAIHGMGDATGNLTIREFNELTIESKGSGYGIQLANNGSSVTTISGNENSKITIQTADTENERQLNYRDLILSYISKVATSL